MNILIIAAHPDDEVRLKSKGMAKWSKHNEVHILIIRGRYVRG